MSEDILDLFRRALGDPKDQSPSMRLARMSMLAGINNDPKFLKVYEDWADDKPQPHQKEVTK